MSSAGPSQAQNNFHLVVIGRQKWRGAPAPARWLMRGRVGGGRVGDFVMAKRRWMRLCGPGIRKGQHQTGGSLRHRPANVASASYSQQRTRAFRILRVLLACQQTSVQHSSRPLRYRELAGSARGFKARSTSAELPSAPACMLADGLTRHLPTVETHKRAADDAKK